MWPDKPLAVAGKPLRCETHKPKLLGADSNLPSHAGNHLISGHLSTHLCFNQPTNYNPPEGQPGAI